MHTLIRTARTTGLFYLGLAITGMLGLPAHPAAALRRRRPRRDAGQPGRPRVAGPRRRRLELLIVLTQALAAVWFYRLFRTVDPLAAGGIAAFGLVNAVAILVSAAMLATAVEVATRPGRRRGRPDRPAALPGQRQPVGRRQGCSSACGSSRWGSCVLRSGWMPRPLGWVLVGRRRRLRPQRVRHLRSLPTPARRRRPRRAGHRGRVLDDRLSADPRRPPARGIRHRISRPCRARTDDQRIKSPTLYQLS